MRRRDAIEGVACLGEAIRSQVQNAELEIVLERRSLRGARFLERVERDGRLAGLHGERAEVRELGAGGGAERVELLQEHDGIRKALFALADLLPPLARRNLFGSMRGPRF